MIRRLSVLAASLAPLLFAAVLIPQTVRAQNPALPAPTNVSATHGDTEALISWQAGAPVSGCTVRAFTVYVYDRYATDPETHNVASSAMISKTNAARYQWYLDGLTPGKAYRAHVYAIDTDGGCGTYSPSSEYVNFTTNTTSFGSDPSEPASNVKKWPFRPREVSVAKKAGQSVTQTTLSFKGSRTNGGSKRCSVNDTYQVHAYRVFNVATGETVGSYTGIDGNTNVAAGTKTANQVREVALTGLTAGTKYRVEVATYSSDCGLWSRYRKFTWTQ